MCKFITEVLKRDKEIMAQAHLIYQRQMSAFDER